MIPYLLIFIAAHMNGLMDVLTHYFHTSIFRDKDKTFWNPNESWKGSKFLGWMRLDAWHLAKFAMIFSIVGAVICYTHSTDYDAIILLIIWGVSFELSYTKIYR